MKNLNLRSELQLINLNEHRVKNILIERLENESQFGENLKMIYQFYARKLVSVCTTEQSKNLVYKHIEDLVNNQFFHGYNLIKSLQQELQSTDSEDFNSLLTISPGLLKSNLRLMIDHLFYDEEKSKHLDWDKNEISEKYVRLFITEIPDCFEVVEKIVYQVALEGAYSNLLQQSKYKEIENFQTLIGNPLDAHYINPEVYALVKTFNNSMTLIDLYKTSDRFKEDVYCGNLEFFNTGENQNLIISVNMLIRHEEYIGICQTLLEKIPYEISSNAMIRTQRIQDVQYFNYIKNI